MAQALLSPLTTRGSLSQTLKGRGRSLEPDPTINPQGGGDFRMEYTSSQQGSLNVLRALTRAEEEVRLNLVDGGLSDLRTIWHRHVRESEAHVFHILASTSPAPDGLVGFFLAEHADLTTRLNTLADDLPSTERMRALVQLIHRLMLHVSMESRALPPMTMKTPGPDLGIAPGAA